MNNLYISISGIIGAGKSSLAKALSKTLNLPCYQENAQDDPYLKLFYESGTKEYGYQLQISLLTKRFEQQQQIIWSNLGGIQDRSIYEDSIFCKMLFDDGKISKLDHETYMKLSNIMFNMMRCPTVIVHLDISPQESLRRMKIRNREIEKSLPLEYLEKLHEYYQEFLKNMKEVKIIRVNYDKYRIDYNSKEEFDSKLQEISDKIAKDIKIELDKNNIVTI